MAPEVLISMMLREHHGIETVPATLVDDLVCIDMLRGGHSTRAELEELIQSFAAIPSHLLFNTVRMLAEAMQDVPQDTVGV